MSLQEKLVELRDKWRKKAAEQTQPATSWMPLAKTHVAAWLERCADELDALLASEAEPICGLCGEPEIHKCKLENLGGHSIQAEPEPALREALLLKALNAMLEVQPLCKPENNCAQCDLIREPVEAALRAASEKEHVDIIAELDHERCHEKGKLLKLKEKP